MEVSEWTTTVEERVLQRDLSTTSKKGGTDQVMKRRLVESARLRRPGPLRRRNKKRKRRQGPMDGGIMWRAEV